MLDAEQRAFDRCIRGGSEYGGSHASANTRYGWPWYNSSDIVGVIKVLTSLDENPYAGGASVRSSRITLSTSNLTL